MITVGMNITLGEAFTLLRKRRGYEKKDVAALADLDIGTIEDIEIDDEEVTLQDIIDVAYIYDLHICVGLTPREPQLLGLGVEKEDTNKETGNEQ